MVLVQPHQFLPVDGRSSDQKSFHMGKPAGMLHLPDRPPDRHHIKITGFQEPDHTVILILFHKPGCFIISCPQKIHQTVHTSADQASLHRKCLRRFRENMQNPLFRDMVWHKRMLGIF